MFAFLCCTIFIYVHPEKAFAMPQTMQLLRAFYIGCVRNQYMGIVPNNPAKITLPEVDLQIVATSQAAERHLPEILTVEQSITKETLNFVAVPEHEFQGYDSTSAKRLEI